MKRCKKILLTGLILCLIQSCSSYEYSQIHSSVTQKTPPEVVGNRPEIPFDPEIAFYPLRIKEGRILPSYQWKVCVKRFIFCTRWEMQTIYFEDLNWFITNDFGLIKRPRP